MLKRFVSSWIPSAGTVIAADYGSLHLINQANSPPAVKLKYLSSTIRAQQSLLLLMLAVAFAAIAQFIFNAKHRL